MRGRGRGEVRGHRDQLTQAMQAAGVTDFFTESESRTCWRGLVQERPDLTCFSHVPPASSTDKAHSGQQ